MTDQVRTLSPTAQFILTRRIPCAALAVLMFTAAIMGAGLSGIPVLATLVLLVGLILHMLTPVLFALVMFGGGLIYALQVAAIATLAITLITDFNLMNGAVFLLLYAFLPIVAAATMGRLGGMGRSAQLLALSLFIAFMTALLAGAGSQGVGVHTFVEQMLAPFFDALVSSVPAGEQATLEALEQMKTMTVWAFPGFLAFSLWLVWWMDILLARRVAVRYGFFQGDHSEMLMIRFSKAAGIALIVAALLANVTDGSVQYMAVSTAIMLAGLLALQGVSVAHMWFRVRGLQLTLVIMYLLLLIWSVMILPFIIIGLLDIWFDFRRSMFPVNGEE
ncbi:MAG: YybS family protein [Mariprofundaceae bacterium]|nr:YybS family protein [Mariprofundaceae bacterium]